MVAKVRKFTQLQEKEELNYTQKSSGNYLFLDG